MKSTAIRWKKVHIATLIALGAGLAACGGGGDGGGQPALLDLTVANHDTVAHASVASLMVMGVSTSVPMLGGPGGVALRNVPMTTSAALGAAFGAMRERPQALIPTAPQACAIAGTATVTFDDLNDNGILMEIGEPATVVFNGCQDSTYYVLDGTAVVTITGGSATSASLTMGMTHLVQNATNGRHTMTLDGTAALNCTELNATSMRCTSTASGPVTATIQTHHFVDTVTLRDGFFEDSTYDDTTGHTFTTMRGTVESAAARGAVSVTTDVAIGSLSSDVYPHEGMVRISGDRGVMRISPISATQVRVDLDHNDDGFIEATDSLAWDELL